LSLVAFIHDQLWKQLRHTVLGMHDAALGLDPPYTSTKIRRMVNEQGAKEAADAAERQA
jgi:hypothetical protein